MLRLLLAPGTAIIARLPATERMILLALVMDLLIGAVLYCVHVDTALAWTDPLMVSVLVVTFIANYQQLAQFLDVRGGVDELAVVIKRMAAGDLDFHSPEQRRGEMRRMCSQLEGMSGSLSGMFSEVRANAASIDSAARKFVSDHADLARRTQEQAAALEQTATSVARLASKVRENADSCQRADGLAKSTSEIAARGERSVHRAVEHMDLIEASSGRIVDIIAVIEGIAFKTNILALNAAVEASRAGEEGRGFAVVASEVRELARRSAQAAKEIRALIEESVGNVADGSKLVDETGGAIGEIVAGVDQVTALIAQVAVASREQSAGVEQITRAIDQMKDVTRQNARLVEEATEATVSFEGSARALTQAVARFKFAS